jgi:hypothetical protein
VYCMSAHLVSFCYATYLFSRYYILAQDLLISMLFPLSFFLSCSCSRSRLITITIIYPIHAHYQSYFATALLTIHNPMLYIYLLSLFSLRLFGAPRRAVILIKSLLIYATFQSELYIYLFVHLDTKIRMDFEG